MTDSTAQMLIVPEPYKVAYEAVPLPPPYAGQVRARTVISGVSHGTEMAAFLGTSPFREKVFTDERVFRPIEPNDPPFYPYRYMGYDAVGIVESVGDDVTDYQLGDRVWCEAFHQTAFAFDHKADNAFTLPDAVPSEEVIMLNLLGVALTAVNDAAIKLGDVVAVVGGGTVGQLIAQTALLNGARQVYLIELAPERREFAAAHSAVIPLDPTEAAPVLQIKANNGGQPPDVVIECTGIPAGLHSAIQTAGLGGTVVAAGFIQGPASDLCLGDEFLHNRVTIKASITTWQCPLRHPGWSRGRVLRESLGVLESRKLNLDGFVSATFPFADGQQAYEAIRDEPGKHLKVALTY